MESRFFVNFWLGFFKAFWFLGVWTMFYVGALIFEAGSRWGIYHVGLPGVDPGHMLAFAACVIAYFALLLLAAIGYKVWAYTSWTQSNSVHTQADTTQGNLK